MEKISTSAVALLPRAANLATLAVVVLATWWSGAQRPVSQADIASASSGATAPSTAALPLHQAGEQSTGGATAMTASWPAAATSIARDSLQAVSFQARAPR